MFQSTLSRNCNLWRRPPDKRNPYGTIRVGSQRTYNSSLPRRSGPTDATTVLMTVRSVRKVKMTQATQGSEGNNNRSHLAQQQPAEKSPNLNAKSAPACLSCADMKHKADTLSNITRKIRAIPAKGIFCNRRVEKTNEGIELGSHTISNSSLLDLDLSEFTSTELAEIMGQMKTGQVREPQATPAAQVSTEC